MINFIFSFFIIKLLKKLIKFDKLHNYEYLKKYFHHTNINCKNSKYLIVLMEQYGFVPEKKRIRFRIYLTSLNDTYYLEDVFLELLIIDGKIQLNHRFPDKIILNNTSYNDYYILYKEIKTIINKIENDQKNVLKYFGF